jgi:hypothetical protein
VLTRTIAYRHQRLTNHSSNLTKVARYYYGSMVVAFPKGKRNLNTLFLSCRVKVTVSDGSVPKRCSDGVKLKHCAEPLLRYSFLQERGLSMVEYLSRLGAERVFKTSSTSEHSLLACQTIRRKMAEVGTNEDSSQWLAMDPASNLINAVGTNRFLPNGYVPTPKFRASMPPITQANRPALTATFSRKRTSNA